MTPAPPAAADPNAQLPPVPPKAAPDPAVARLEAELAQQRKTTQQIMEKLDARAPVPHAQPNSVPVDKKALEKEFFANPLDRTADIARTVSEAVTRRFAQEMGPQMDSLKQLAKDKIRSTDPETYDKYAMEIEAQVASCDANLQTNPQVWASAFNVIKGMHMSEIVAAERAKAPENRAPAVHISHEGGPAAPSRGAPAPASAKLSEDEQNVARQLGLTNEEYQRGKDHIAGQRERGPSSWDPYITFDSREKARKQREQQRADRNRKPAAA